MEIVSPHMTDERFCCRTDLQKRELYRGKKNPEVFRVHLKYLVEYCSMHGSEENVRGQKKTPMKNVEKTASGARRGMGVLPVSISQTGKLRTSIMRRKQQSIGTNQEMKLMTELVDRDTIKQCDSTF